ncbi:hypothetical protein Ato02nite_089460 [Paractinoplanes toevensis]|uniref:Uncharacterized protein n=1 Tax=Paractinoplanes toevensis TaxID=571911 RepID=A0A920BQF3_9ACTN|nr:hypothetical protein Ato02nite_089460 [Actinoplanes toevensis]
MENLRRNRATTQQRSQHAHMWFLAAVAAAVPLLGGCTTTGQATAAGIACDGRNAYCGRPVRGEGPRHLPTAGVDYGALQATDFKIAAFAMNDGWCLTHTDQSCNEHPTRHQPGPDDVRQAKAALQEAGYSDNIVRLADSSDPAPPGSLLYAVRVGDICFIGHAAELPQADGDSYHGIAGQFTDGRCL